jgi:hypothetical protein
MPAFTPVRRCASGAAVLAVVSLAACGGDDGGSPDAAPVTDLWTLASVTIDAEGARTTYVQTLTSLDITSVSNATALEIQGNGTVQLAGGKVYVGLADEPTVVRYGADASGRLVEEDRISFLNEGLAGASFGNVMVSPTKAFMLSTEQYTAVVWNPETMEITGSVDLGALRKEGTDAEFWTVTHHEGRVYVPVRYANWTTGVIDRSVILVVIDAATNQVLATLRDERCYSGGRPAFAPNGDAYVLADGRSWSAQLFATVAGQPVPATCLLRIPAGQLAFDPDYLVEVPGIANGHDAAGELETADNGSGVAFAKLFHIDQLPDGVTIGTDFGFWSAPAFKMWRFELGPSPTATAVIDIPFGALGWEGSVADGTFWVGESPDYSHSIVYAIDPATNTATRRFEMEGTFYGLRRLR